MRLQPDWISLSDFREFIINNAVALAAATSAATRALSRSGKKSFSKQLVSTYNLIVARLYSSRSRASSTSVDGCTGRFFQKRFICCT